MKIKYLSILYVQSCFFSFFYFPPYHVTISAPPTNGWCKKKWDLYHKNIFCRLILFNFLVFIKFHRIFYPAVKELFKSIDKVKSNCHLKWLLQSGLLIIISFIGTIIPVAWINISELYDQTQQVSLLYLMVKSARLRLFPFNTNSELQMNFTVLKTSKRTLLGSSRWGHCN